MAMSTIECDCEDEGPPAGSLLIFYENLFLDSAGGGICQYYSYARTT